MEAKKLERELVSLNEAIEVLNKHYGNDPEKSGRDVFAKGTLYNAISKGRLKNYGIRHFVQVSIDELILEFGNR